MTDERYCPTHRNQTNLETLSKTFIVIGILLLFLSPQILAQTESEKGLSERLKLKFADLKELKLSASEQLSRKLDSNLEELKQVRLSFDDSFKNKLKNKYDEVKRIRTPFDLSVYRGKTRATGLFGIGGEYTVLKDEDGNEIKSVSAGSAILFRGSGYRKINRETGEWTVGSCFSPGSEGGFSGASYTLEGDICVGSGNRTNLELTLGGSGSVGGKAMGVQLKVFEWEKKEKKE